MSSRLFRVVMSATNFASKLCLIRLDAPFVLHGVLLCYLYLLRILMSYMNSLSDDVRVV